MDISRILRKDSHLVCWRWLVIVLMVAGLSWSGRSSAAQAGPWHSGQIGVRWALWMDRPTTMLATLNDPSSSDLLLAASDQGAVVIDLRTVTSVWDYELEEGGGTPLLQDNTLYFHNTAFDALTGRQLWRAPTTEPGPMLLTDDALYLVGSQETWAVNPETGDLLWQVPTIHQGTMLLEDGALYIVGSDGTWAVNPDNGELLWHSPTDVDPRRPWLCCKPPILFDDTLVVNEIYGLARGLDVRTGQPRWQQSWLIGQNPAAGMVYVLKDEPGRMVELGSKEPVQVLALDPADGRVLWVYPTTDAAGTCTAPRPISWGWEVGPLVDGETVYAVVLDGRIVALEASSGVLRWVSEPVVSTNVYRGNSLNRVGQALVAGSDVEISPFVGLDTDTGKTLWRREYLSGHLVAAVDNDILLIQKCPIPWWQREQLGIREFYNLGICLLYLVQAETGQLLGNLALEPFIERSVFVVGSHDYVYFERDGFIYAIGPAAPGEAVAMARTFFARGDYRSAARTLSALRTADEQGYVANGGEAAATEVLNAWLTEAEASMENTTYFNWPEDLRDEVERLQIQDVQVRMLGPKQRPPAPRMEIGGPMYLGWWYVPFVLPLVVFLASVGVNRKRKNIYRAGVTAGLSCWGGLVYLVCVGNLLLGSRLLIILTTVTDLSDESPFGFDIALIGGVPLAVWLLTRSKNYTLIAFALSVIHRYLLYASLLTMPV